MALGVGCSEVDVESEPVVCGVRGRLPVMVMVELEDMMMDDDEPVVGVGVGVGVGGVVASGGDGRGNWDRS